jgi:hypothetical protein
MSEITQKGLLTAEEKKRDLYLRQKELLDTFLEHGAISQAQYDKSLGDLTVKMGMESRERKMREDIKHLEILRDLFFDWGE